MARSLGVDGFAGALGEAHLAAVLKEAVADPGRPLPVGRIDMGDVGDVDRRLDLGDAACCIAEAGRGA